MADETREGLWQKTGPEILKVAIGVAGGFITGILAVLNPYFGEQLLERLDPTSAIVTGHVVKDQVPVQNAVVMLNGVVSDETGGAGLFLFEEVEKGRHQYDILAGGELAFREEFYIQQRTVEHDIGEINLAAVPLPPLRADALNGDEAEDIATEVLEEVEEVATEVDERSDEAATEADEGDDGDEAPTEAAIGQATPAAGASPIAAAASPVADAIAGTQAAVIGVPTISSGGFAGDIPADAGDDMAPPATEEPAEAEEQLALVLDTSPIPTEELVSGMAAGAHRVDVHLDGPANLLARIDRVTYYLDPSFNPSVVSRFEEADAFLLSFVTPGPFPLTAKVVFTDGTVVELEQTIGF